MFEVERKFCSSFKISERGQNSETERTTNKRMSSVTCIGKLIEKQTEIVTIPLQKAKYVLIVVSTNSYGRE